MSFSVRLLVLAFAGALTVSCGSGSPGAASASAPLTADSPAGATPLPTVAVAASAAATPVPSACPSAASRLAPRRSPLPTPVAAFTGENGASKVVAIVESVDVTGQRVTLTFPNSATGGLATPAALTARATLRVTSASVLQQIVAHEIALTAPVPVGGTKLSLAEGAPALPARAPVLVVGVDCGAITTTVRTTLTQAVIADSKEWTIATPLGTPLPGGAVISSEVAPLALSDLKEGDALIGPGGGALLFGLVFSGRAPDYVLTRLLRACRTDPCPAPPA